MSKNNWLAWLFIVLGIALMLRLPHINDPFTGEESVWYFCGQSLSSDFTLSEINNVVPVYNFPIPCTTYRFVSLIFGLETSNLRLISIVFGLINILLVFYLGKKLFGEKAGLYSAGLMAIMPWHLFESAIIEHDGSFLMFFYLTIFLSYLKFEETKNKFWFALSVFLFVLALMSKISAVLIVAILIAYVFIKKIEFKKLVSKKTLLAAISAIKEGLVFGVAGVLALILFFLITKVFTPIYYSAMVSRMFEAWQFSHGFNAFSIVRILIYLVLWGSPLVLGLSILSLTRWNNNKLLLTLWMFIPIMAYSTSVYSAGIDRYLSIIIPAMCLLSGSFVAELKFNKWGVVAGTLCAFVIFTVLNYLPAEYLVHNTSTYISKMVSFNWNFLFPFYGASGPAFLVSFLMLGFGIVASIIALLGAITLKKNFIALFICISLGMNLVVVNEYLFQPQHASISRVTHEMAKEYVPKEDMLFVDHAGIAILLNRTGSDVRDISDCNETECRAKIAKGADLLLIDFPKKEDNSLAKTLANECTLERSIEDRGLILGFIYSCHQKV